VDSSKAEERMISSLSGLSLYSDLSSKGGGGIGECSGSKKDEGSSWMRGPNYLLVFMGQVALLQAHHLRVIPLYILLFTLASIAHVL